MEITIGILGFIVVIVAVEYFFFSKRKGEKEDKEEEQIDPIEVRFKATQKLSEEVQLDIENYILKADAADKPLFKDMTFSEYLAHLKETHSENLSDSLYERLSKLELTKSNSVFIIKSLEFQFSALLQIKNKMQVLDLLYSKRLTLSKGQN
ncbi:MAG: hypothetical protein AAF611_21460 [Bacteroidota bacterium]